MLQQLCEQAADSLAKSNVMHEQTCLLSQCLHEQTSARCCSTEMHIVFMLNVDGCCCCCCCHCVAAAAAAAQEEMYSFVTAAQDQDLKGKGTTVVQDS